MSEIRATSIEEMLGARAADTRRAAAAPVEAADAQWYADLEKGSGAAQGMPRRLRAALALVTADAAREDAARTRADSERRQAAERAQAERRRVEAERAAREREREAAAAAQRAEEQRAARRRSVDRRVLGVAVVLSVTVLVPWLIGKFFLRDSVHDRLGGVYDLAARDDGRYFQADWFGGVGVLLVLAAVIVLIGSWRRRASTVTAALVVGVFAGAVVLPASADRWTDAEWETLQVLASTSYPFGERWATCGSRTFDVLGEDGGAYHHFQVWTARTVGADTCNRLEVYDGWRKIGEVTLPAGETFQATGEVSGGWALWTFTGTSAADSGVVTTTSTGHIVGLVLGTPDEMWRVPAAGAALSYHDAGLVIATIEQGLPASRVNAIDARTGTLLWTATCPSRDQEISSPAFPGDGGTIGIRCQGPRSFGDTGSRTYTLGLNGVLVG